MPTLPSTALLLGLAGVVFALLILAVTPPVSQAVLQMVGTEARAGRVYTIGGLTVMTLLATLLAPVVVRFVLGRASLDGASGFMARLGDPVLAERLASGAALVMLVGGGVFVLLTVLGRGPHAG